MGEGKMAFEEDSDGPAVLKIMQQTTQLLEARRKKEEAKIMARLLKNVNYEALRELAEAEPQIELCQELDLEESEADRLRRLHDMEEEMAAGLLLTHEPCGMSKYESPLVTQLRSIETVDEMYHLADKIIPLTAKDL